METVSQYIRSVFDRFDFSVIVFLSDLEYDPVFKDALKACVLHVYAKPNDEVSEELIEASFGELISDEAKYQIIGGMMTRALGMNERNHQKDGAHKASIMPFLVDALEKPYSQIVEMLQFEAQIDARYTD